MSPQSPLGYIMLSNDRDALSRTGRHSSVESHEPSKYTGSKESAECPIHLTATQTFETRGGSPLLLQIWRCAGFEEPDKFREVGRGYIRHCPELESTT
jgi:hypothetical protein